MKTYITILFLSLSLLGYSQNNKREKIEALKIAHITNEVNLSSKEAQQFWPIYNEFETLKREVRETEMKLKRKLRSSEISESQAKDLVKNFINLEERKIASYKTFISKLNGVISAKKILKFIQAERSFKRKMIEEFKGRHRGDRR